MKLLSYKIPVNSGSYRRKKNVGNLKVPDGIRHIVGASSKGHMLASEMIVLPCFRKMIHKNYDNIYYGRTDD